jgi:hypothetical protein
LRASDLDLDGLYLPVLGSGPSVVGRYVRYRAQFGFLCCERRERVHQLRDFAGRFEHDAPHDDF